MAQQDYQDTQRAMDELMFWMDEHIDEAIWFQRLDHPMATVRFSIYAHDLGEEIDVIATGHPVSFLSGDDLESRPFDGEEFQATAIRNDQIIEPSVNGTLDQLLQFWIFQDVFDPKAWALSRKELTF